MLMDKNASLGPKDLGHHSQIVLILWAYYYTTPLIYIFKIKTKKCSARHN
jgi:hypothetical protein